MAKALPWKLTHGQIGQLQAAVRAALDMPSAKEHDWPMSSYGADSYHYREGANVMKRRIHAAMLAAAGGQDAD